MKLFTVGKVGIFCDGIGHRLERRKNQDVKVVDLSLRVQPFTSQLAAALDTDAYAFVKRILFKANGGDPITDLRSVEFKPFGDSQKLICFASPDTTEPSIAFDQVKVTKIRARTEKGVDGWALIVGVTFGPVGRAELEYVNAFYTEQRFITFDDGEPFLEFEDDGEDEASDRDLDARRPAPMFNDEGTETEQSPATRDAKRSAPAARQKIHSHARGRRRSTRA